MPVYRIGIPVLTRLPKTKGKKMSDMDDIETMTTAQWEALASDYSGGCYGPWFSAMAELQKSIDLNSVDAAEGMNCHEQVALMENRVNAALAKLRKAAKSGDYGLRQNAIGTRLSEVKPMTIQGYN